MRNAISTSTLLDLILAVSLLLAQGANAQAVDAGNLERVSGSATITSANNQTRTATANTKIQPGDTITTATGSEALIKMTDDTVVTLRPNTQFQFTDFKYDNKPTDSMVSTLLRGTARMVSGLIGKSRPTNVAVRASTATIGIRGTDFEIALVAQDEGNTRAGIYNYVHDGRTNVTLAQGPSADVPKDKTAFAPANLRPGESPLQILDDRPVFLQSGGGFDALMQSLTMQPINVIQQMPTFR
jgi:FecR protein